MVLTGFSFTIAAFLSALLLLFGFGKKSLYCISAVFIMPHSKKYPALRGYPGSPSLGFPAAGNPLHLALALQSLAARGGGLISVSADGRLCGLSLSIQHPANELTH